jgi:hypothetical protein
MILHFWMLTSWRKPKYRTDEIHPQQVPLSPVAIPFAHDFECFDFCIDIFNNNPLTWQLAVK